MDTLLKATIIILHESSIHDNFNLTYETNKKTGQGHLIQTFLEDHISTCTDLCNQQSRGLFLNNSSK